MYAMVSKSSFAVWLENVLREQGISQSELARRANVTRSAINGILTGARGPGVELSKGIAKALKIPPEQVFIAAGLFPADADDDPWVEEMSHKLSLLSPRVREIAGKIIDAMADAEGEPNNKAKTKPKSITS